MGEQKSTYFIVRRERINDPQKIETEGLRIGSWQGCELFLNHPSVSSLHAGIREIDGRFYVTDLSPSNSTTLNGRLIIFCAPEALADGDVLQIGPFFLEISRIDKMLGVEVSQHLGFNIANAQMHPDTTAIEHKPDAHETRSAPPEVARALELFWNKRTRIKAAPITPLHPQQQRSAGKARFYWEPTSDLARTWPISIFIWSLTVVGALLWTLTHWYPQAFSPGPLSEAHAHTTLTDGLARQPNSGACMTCHAHEASIDDNCAACHQTESFIATTTKAHRDAGITCTVCHTEHKGADFKPMNAALDSCTVCHNDNNKKTYNGKSVHTPHGGTLGYPVVGSEWVWKGLDAEELALKPEVAKLRRPNDTEQQWRNKQFHALHIYRVRSVASIEGIKDEDAGNGMRVVSCSSCHRSFAPIDRVTPRSTCIRCHNGAIFEKESRSVRSSGAISCTSCHVQHIRDTHWRPSLFVEQPLPPDWHEIVTGK